MEFTTNKILAIDHMVMTTNDMGACIQFYQLLGFVCIDAQCRYEFYAGNFKINVHYLGRELEPKAALAACGTLDLCFEVEGSLSSWRELLQLHNYEVSDIGIKSGFKKKMQSFYVRDPDQNLIELCTYITID